MVRRSAIPLILGTFLLRVNTGAGGIVLGLFLARLAIHAGHRITAIQVGLLAVVYYATELTLAPLMGALSDRWGRRLFMMLGPLLGVLVMLLVPLTPAASPLPFLLTLQVLSGLATAMITPAVLGYLADLTRRNEQGRMRVMGFYELATSGGIAAGVVVGGFAWDRFGPWAFALLALFYALVTLCMFLAPRVIQVTEHTGPALLMRRYLAILHKPRLFIFIPAWICISALLGIWVSSQLPFLLSRPGRMGDQLLMGIMSGPGGGGRLSLVLGSYVLFFGLSLLFWACFLAHLPRLVMMLTSVAGLYLGVMALWGMNHRLGGDLAPGIWIPVLLLGIFAESSFAPSALAYLADLTEESAMDRGLLMGLYSVFLGLGQLLGNGLAGLFAHHLGFDGLICLTAILGLVALLSLLTLRQLEQHYATKAKEAGKASVTERSRIASF
ncbi:MFS transporter [Thermogemmatispora onikobensis]|uniref:MFS transporter n=1 Tax=Thermogemmatispora onikobensis TaxID=732234 RepID=UPI000852FCFD|nr:MFS transporter [Thermogemmatispora onikobensis]